jgi:hypothetical protein
VGGADRQRPELVKGEAPVREVAGDMLDPVQLGLADRISGLLPGPRALKRDALRMQDLAQPFAPEATGRAAPAK